MQFIIWHLLAIVSVMATSFAIGYWIGRYNVRVQIKSYKSSRR